MLKQKLLVLTALETTWGESEELLFLGEWCKLYDRREIWRRRNYETVLFHWDDREKLAKDYDDLAGLHQRLLSCLTDALNRVHGVNYSLRYWQILLDPWLMAYIGVFFDRWEHLRIAFESNEHLQIVFLENHDILNPSFSYEEFINDILTDEWNQAFLQRIIQYEYLEQCHLQRNSFTLKKTLKEKSKTKRGLLGKVIAGIDRSLSFLPNPEVVLFMSNFKLLPLMRLNLALKQIPRLFLREFECSDVKLDVPIRERLNISFDPQSRFEDFLYQCLIQDLPITLLEGYRSLCDQVNRIPLKPKAMLTASAHWQDKIAKMWFAERVKQGSKLVVLEHGGSLPARKELFNFEEDIADIKGTWFTPYHAKHRQVVPSKLVSRYKKKNTSHDYCVVIGNECSRWVFRSHFYPMGAQCLVSYDQTIRFYELLDEQVKACFKIRPYPDQGLNTQQRFTDSLGEEKILNVSTIDKAFALAKVIICTYPETTFSEAMASGIPTLLIYPELYYERHRVAEDLLHTLRAAQIVFHDEKATAEHLNDIWSNPSGWWQSTHVIHARDKFQKLAMRLNNHWKDDWAHFIRDNIT